ncbi:unnamed protein product [Dibothriocephalus latus]|uniref:Protein Wnt n=1 Tax=Dibothriocephalus latus TaxID=60516 RepID=A0A3P7NKS0_DIBLA|nr:unnamed protein product [Dibothriocephalus latus]
MRKQRNLCLRYIQLMESVVRGYFMGLRECEYQFAAHRWNCQGYNLTIREPTRRKSASVLRPNQVERKEPKRLRTYMDRLLSSVYELQCFMSPSLSSSPETAVDFGYMRCL